MLKGPAHYSHSYLSCFKTLWWYVVVLSHFIWKNSSAEKLNMNCGHFPEFNQDLFGLYFSLIGKLNNPPYWKGCVYLVVVGVWFSDTWETKSELVPNDPRWDWVFDVHFFLLKSPFKWSVCYGVVPTTNLHTTSRERETDLSYVYVR